MDEVEYLIHYVKFKMWPDFPRFLNFGVRQYIISPNLHKDWQLGFWVFLKTRPSNFSHVFR